VDSKQESITMIEGKRILMTGGAGFIGTKLCGVLADKNKIFVYDSLRRNSLITTALLNHENVCLFKGDVLDSAQLQQSVAEIQPQIVIHMAAIAGIDTVIISPTTTAKVNMIGTYNALEAIKPFISTIERFINFSTSEVFGIHAFRVDESHSTTLAPVGEARWTYAVSKLAAEHLTHGYYKEFGLPAVNLRPFNVYGPGQVGESAIHVFVTRAIANQDIQIHGHGAQIRSWCYIDDMVQGILLCLEKEEAVGNVFNIGDPRGTITIKSLAEKIIQLSGSRSKIVHVPMNYVDVELRVPNIDKAEGLLGYNPRVDLDEGLKRTIEWYISHSVGQ
jgi:dTDP-glucose 4,6-dehydratase